MSIARTCTVSFKTSAGEYAHTTNASSLFEAAHNAIRFWNTEFWRGPRPGPETVLEVGITGTTKRWRVKVQRVEEEYSRTER